MSPYTSDDDNLQGVLNPDFLALGLGGTNMMSMLWAVAMGRRAVGIEMRGDPFLGVHWNIRADLYHQLGLIDNLMLERYGEDRIPRRGNREKPFLLAETLYSTETRAGDIVADEIIDGFDMEQHIVGVIHHVEFIDDRWRDGVPNRSVTLLTPPRPPTRPDEALIRTSMLEVLDGPSTFQAGAASVLVLLRRYLEKMEQMDLELGVQPRVRLLTRHRVVNTPEGFINLDDGRIGFRVEALHELDFKGKFVRVRRPGSKVIEVGVPDLFMIAQGFHSTDAERLGFKQEDVVVDHKDGRGPVVAQADYLAGLIEALVGGRLRRRIASAFDERGDEYWVRQIAVGHEEDPEVGWCLVQVPDFKTFDPIAEGLVPQDTDTRSPEYFAAYEHLLYEFYVQQVGETLELPPEDVRKIQMVYGPKLFTLVERMGSSALLAPNGVVAGDSFGNGHFMTSGGAMTGMVGHSRRVYEYYQARDAGSPHSQAIRTLADKIREDTLSWLQVSAREYSEAAPINFGAERIAQIEAQSGIPSSARATSIDASRRHRHDLLPLDPSDWRRLFLRNGKVYSVPLPELHAMHPALRKQRPRKSGAHVSVVFVACGLEPMTVQLIEGVLGQPGVKLGLITSAPVDELPERLSDRLSAVQRISNPCDLAQIVNAVDALGGVLGRPERLLGTADELQIVLAEAREKLGIEGMRAEQARGIHDTSRMREKLEDAGLPIARYARIDSVEAGLAFGTEIGYYPLVVKPNERESPENTHLVRTEEELRALLERLQPTEERPLICEELVNGRECTLDVISLGGVPAWFSATRFGPRLRDVSLEPDAALTIALPREHDDPADPLLRRMGFAALKALGIETGMCSISWIRSADGSRTISNVTPTPPPGFVVSLMGLAHGADMYRAWGNLVVNGLFAPIPRLYAAGAVFLPHREMPLAALDETLRELGDVVVQHDPKSQARTSDGVVFVRHAETAVVEDAMNRVIQAVRARPVAASSVSVG